MGRYQFGGEGPRPMVAAQRRRSQRRPGGVDQYERFTLAGDGHGADVAQCTNTGGEPLGGLDERVPPGGRILLGGPGVTVGHALAGQQATVVGVAQLEHRARS